MKLDDPRLEKLLDPELYAQLQEDLELLQELGGELDLEAVHAGQMTPFFFGSAMSNFGVELFLENFLKYALEPGGRNSSPGHFGADLS